MAQSTGSSFRTGEEEAAGTVSFAEDRSHHPVVFLPGHMADARVFAPVIEAVGRHTPCMVAPISGADSIEAIARLLADQLPPRFTLVGAGLGGMVAMELLQRQGNRLCGLCLIGASPLAESPAKAAEREPWIIRARSGRLRGVMQEVFPADTLAPGVRRSQVLTDIGDMAEALGADVFVEQTRMLQRRADYQAALRRITVPALLIFGAHDPLVPQRRQMVMAELMGQARLAVLENAGHFPLQEESAQVADLLLDWIVGASQVVFRHSDQKQA